MAAATRLAAIVLAMLLAATMLPAVGLQSAYADEPAERPATTSGDVALEGATEAAPVAQQREDGMLIADGLAYTVTDGGIMLVGFDSLPQGEDALKEIVVPEAVSVDGEDTAVVSVAIAGGNVAESVVALTLPQSINDVDTATLAAALPNLSAIEVASPKASSAPVAAGVAALRARYSSFGGVLYRNSLAASESDASRTTLAKELVWAPPATVVARIPAECTSIAPGAFVDVKDLRTVVCFGVMENIPLAQKSEDGTVTPGAFTDEQIQTVNIIVPQTGTVVPDGERVSADVAVTDDSTMDIKREAWWKSGFASDRITLGEVCGSTTNTLPVTEEGTLETAEAVVAYAPETTQNSSSRKAGIEPPGSAIPTPVPDDDQIDPSESGLVFTHLADMTLSVSWKGDSTATPSHIDIPAYATINGVAYPVTEIAPYAFEGAVFLTSVTIPEGVTTIGESAFAGCANLKDATFPSTLRTVAPNAFDGAIAPVSALPVPVQKAVLSTNAASDDPQQSAVSAVADPAGGDVASGDAFAPIDPADPAVSEPDALMDSEGKEAPAGDGVVTPLTDDSISSFSSLASGLTTDYVSVDTLGYSASALSVFSSSEASYSASDFARITFASPVNTVAASAQGYPNYERVYIAGYNGTKQVGWISLYAASGFRIVSCSDATLDKYLHVNIGIVRDEAVGSNELALASHSHDTYLSKSSDLNDLTNKTAARTNLGLGSLATKNSLAWSEISGKPASFTPSSHTHTMSNITDLKKYGKNDNVAWADVSGKPTFGTLASKNSVAWSEVTGKPTSFTPSAHTHDDRYYTEGETDGKLDAKAAWGQLSKEQGTYQDADGKRVEDAIKGVSDALDSAKEELQGDIDEMAKEIAGGFGTIRYEGLDGDSDAGVYPTSYKAGGTPSLHEPVREGWDFAGWEWSRGDASGDGGNLAEAFASAGEVVLTATWAQEAPKGTYFFTERDPLTKVGPAPQEHVIKVVMTRTRSYPVDRVEFSWDNWTGLIAEGASVTLTVGTDYDEATGEIRNGRSCTLTRDGAGSNKASITGLGMYPVQFASRQCGLYVGISVPDGAVDRVVESYTEGSYVDSLVKMSYALAG